MGRLMMYSGFIGAMVGTGFAYSINNGFGPLHALGMGLVNLLFAIAAIGILAGGRRLESAVREHG